VGSKGREGRGKRTTNPAAIRTGTQISEDQEPNDGSMGMVNGEGQEIRDRPKRKSRAWQLKKLGRAWRKKGNIRPAENRKFGTMRKGKVGGIKKKGKRSQKRPERKHAWGTDLAADWGGGKIRLTEGGEISKKKKSREAPY